MTDDETNDDTLDVRSAEEIAEANGVDVEVVKEGIEAMAAADEMAERDAEIAADRADALDDEENLEDVDVLIEDLPDDA